MDEHELEKIIAAVVARKNAARDDSAAQEFYTRQLRALRYTYEEAGGIIEQYDPMNWGCYCRPLWWGAAWRPWCKPEFPSE